MESSAATHAQNADVLDGSAALARHAPSPARERGPLLGKWLVLADVVAALAAALVMDIFAAISVADLVALALLAALAWPAVAFSIGLYSGDGLRFWVSGASEAPRGLVAIVLFTWPLYGAITLVGVQPRFSVTVGMLAATLVFSAVGRASARGGLHRVPKLRQRVLILGSGVVAGQLAGKLRTHDQFGLELVGLVDDDPHPLEAPELPWLGGLADLDDVIATHDVDRVIIAFSRATHHELLGCIRVCLTHGVAVNVVPRLFELLDGVGALDHVGGLPLLSVSRPSLGRPSRVAKRVLDGAGAGVALVVLAPVLLALALAIKLDSRGPVLFRQPRVGRDGRTFNLLKLRSMRTDADQRKHELVAHNDLGDGVMFKIHRDPRITRIGRLMRRYSLDELPQLVNVLRGDMSLVGPRPLIHVENDALAEDWHLRRLELRPGLTGLWQIHGRSETPFQEMVRMDYQYVAGWSLARDVEILLATVPAVLSGRGAY